MSTASIWLALLMLSQVWKPADPRALEPVYRQALEESEARWGRDHPKTARAASDLGMFLRGRGEAAGAERHLRRALDVDRKALGEKHALVAADRENLAGALETLGRVREAIELYRQAAEGPDPALAARSLAKVASYLEGAEAEAVYRQALAFEETASGKDHPRVALRLNDLALALRGREAEALFRRALAIQEKALGPDHPETAVTLNNLASLVLATGKVAAAEPMQRRALAILEDKLGTEHPRVATACSNLADVLRAKGDIAGAQRLYRRALQIDEAAYGAEHPEVAVDLENLASVSDEATAKDLRRRAEAIQRRARRR